MRYFAKIALLMALMTLVITNPNSVHQAALTADIKSKNTNVAHQSAEDLKKLNQKELVKAETEAVQEARLEVERTKIALRKLIEAMQRLHNSTGIKLKNEPTRAESLRTNQ